MTTFSYLVRKCFGTRGERLVRTLVLCAVVYGGLSAAGWRVAISPFVLGLMAGVFSGGVMGRALTAADAQTELRHQLMLPCAPRALVLGYVGAMVAYTLATKTLPLLAVLFAIGGWTSGTLLLAWLCALNGVLLAALFVGVRRGRWAVGFWAIALLAMLRVCAGRVILLPILALSAFVSVGLLARGDAYALLQRRAAGHKRKISARHFLMLRYFLRRLFAHKNYLVNTVGLWLVAAALPFFFAGFAETLFVAPLGFAILTLNTPLGVLLSADPALDRTVRMLPGGLRHFCLPYAALLTGAALVADIVFLGSWTITIGPVTLPMLAAALFIALQSAIASVWLEWRHPLRNWRIESDLWHHPRKYLVPGVMLFLAAAIGSWPALLAPCWLVLTVEGVDVARCVKKLYRTS